MGCGASRQNRVEATSDNAMRSDRGHPTGTSMSRPENDRALKISPVSIRVSLPGSILPQEVQPNTNYHMRRNFSRQSDGLVQFVHVAADNNVDREVGLTTGRCCLCFNFLFCFCFCFCFFFFRFGICLSYTILYIP